MKFSLIRADDQVHLDVETFNLEPQRVGNGYELRPVTAGQPGHIALAFPKQHVMERVGTTGRPKSPAERAHLPRRQDAGGLPRPRRAPPHPLHRGRDPGGPPRPGPGHRRQRRHRRRRPRARGPPCRPRRRSWCWTPWASRPTARRTARRPAALPARRGAPPRPPGRTGTTGPRSHPFRGRSLAARSRHGPGHSGAPGEALLAELKARALARRSAPRRSVALEAPAPGRRSPAPLRAETPDRRPHGTARAAPGRRRAGPRSGAGHGSTAGAPGVTAMGFPSKLSLSVAGGATRMAHAAQPVVNGGNVELWHSRLARRTASGKLVELPTSIAAFRVHAAIETTRRGPLGRDDQQRPGHQRPGRHRQADRHRDPQTPGCRPAPGACGSPPWGPGWTPAGTGPGSPCRAGATAW